MASQTSLTENDRKILTMAFESFKNTPAVDYVKLQAMGGYKTPASATASYAAARKKLLSSNMAKMTDNDHKIILMGWQCFKTQPEVDYKKLQAKSNYKTTASATASYIAAKKKLLGSATDPSATLATADGDSDVPAPPTKARGIKRKVGKKAASEYEGLTAKRVKGDVKVKNEEGIPGSEVDEKEGEEGGESSAEAEGDADGVVEEKLFATAQEYLEEGREEGA